MSIENRKTPRRLVRHPARIVNPDDSKLLLCTIVDVSATGAKLELREPAEVPREFTILLSDNASVSRQCQVSWQSGTKVGVRFIIAEVKKAALG
jgi:hypothetical protein